MESLELRAVSFDSPEATGLLDARDSELRERYRSGGEHGSQPPSSLRAEQFDPPGGVFLVAFLRGRPVGCGGMRRHDERTAEVKRMFVDTSARRQGVGRQVLRALEDAARASGYRAIRLETGIEQPDAMALYESEGYGRIPPYGQWKDSPRSVCYEKGITGVAG